MGLQGLIGQQHDGEAAMRRQLRVLVIGNEQAIADVEHDLSSTGTAHEVFGGATLSDAEQAAKERAAPHAVIVAQGNRALLRQAKSIWPDAPTLAYETMQSPMLPRLTDALLDTISDQLRSARSELSEVAGAFTPAAHAS